MRKLALPALIFGLAAAPAFAAEAPLSSRQAQGKAVFDATCTYCHAGNGWAARAIAARRSMPSW